MRKWLILLTILPFTVPLAYADTPEDMVEMVNQARSQARKCGGKHYAAAPPLRLNDRLQSAAQKHADDMANKGYFSHTSQDGRSPYQRMEQEGYAFWRAAENIAYGQRSVASVIHRWLNSAGHCANIMDAEVSEMGMAQSGLYWVQTFGKPR